MIKSVLIFKNGGVNVRYENGKRADYSKKNTPKSVTNFILREDVKAYENDYSVMYKLER